MPAEERKKKIREKREWMTVEDWNEKMGKRQQVKCGAMWGRSVLSYRYYTSVQAVKV